ncbi:MAG: 30S ribosomal protein S13 [Candidatus Micrarchaeota archaeon]|nr:30S ribosomal protein S13 [Candidatus Micrarchaeota archaeon]
MAEEAAKGKPQRGRRDEKSGATSIIRLAGKDMNGALPIPRALAQVKGIGSNMANSLSHAIETKIGIPRTTPVGQLDEKQIAAVEDVIKNPGKFNIPAYLLNRRKDMETGKDMHFVGNDLIFATRQDVNRDITLNVWRGFRHQFGQKVRGQRTRSTGRTGATVGVTKKSAAAPAPAAGAKPTAEKKPAPAAK